MKGAFVDQAEVTKAFEFFNALLEEGRARELAMQKRLDQAGISTHGTPGKRGKGLSREPVTENRGVVGDGGAGDGTAMEVDAEVRTGKNKPPGTGRSSVIRQKTIIFERLFDLVKQVGGRLQFHNYLMDMMKRGIGGTGARHTHIVLQKDFIKQLVDDPQLRKEFEKEIDRRRKPPICAFRHACQLVTQAGVDAFRFAMHKCCPGHETLAKDKKAFVRHASTVWCPNGETIASPTALDDEEQRELALFTDVAAREEATAEEREGEAALDEEARTECATVDDFPAARKTLAIELLRGQFPKDSDEQLRRRFSDEGTETPRPGLLVHVYLMRKAKRQKGEQIPAVVVGFIKARVIKNEIYLEYALFTPGMRNKRMVQHLVVKLLDTYGSKDDLFWLQVRTDDVKALGMCEGKLRADLRKRQNVSLPVDVPREHGGLCLKEVSQPATGNVWVPSNTPEGTIFMGASVGIVKDAVEKTCGNKKLLPTYECVLDGPECEVADGAAFEGDGEDERDTELAEEQQCAEPQLKKHWGARTLSDTLQALLVPHWTQEVVLPGSASQFFLFKLTCDAARLRHAPQKFRVVTTVIAQLISAGVGMMRDGYQRGLADMRRDEEQLRESGPDRAREWGPNVLRCMMAKPQSCNWAFCMRVWFDKDDRTNVSNPNPNRK